MNEHLKFLLNPFAPTPQKSAYIFKKRSSGRKFPVMSLKLGSAGALAELPIDELLSPIETTDTFDLYVPRNEGQKRLSFARMKTEHYACDAYHAFLFGNSKGNASLVVARRQIRPPEIVIMMLQINFSGGKTTAMITLAEMLKACGFKVKVVALWLTSTPPIYSLPDGIEFDYVDSYMEMQKGEESLKLFPPDLTMSDRTRDRITTFFSNLETDAIYFPDYDSELHSMVFNLLDNKIVRIIGDHNPGRASATMDLARVPGKSVKNKYFIAAANAADAVHVVNPALGGFYAKSLKKSILPIANPVSVRTDSMAEPFSSRKVIVVGRYSDEKRIPDAIQAFSIASEMHPDWTMDIYGQGTGLKSIEAALMRSPARDRIELNSPTPDVLDRMAECAIHLSASVIESFGLTIAEAMAIGCPVVSRGHAGSYFLLSDGRGTIAEGHSVESLATALSKVMDDVENESDSLREQIAEGRQFISQLTPEHIGKQWRSAIITLLNKKFN